MNKTFFFDLDGTLLGMDQDKFLGHYFSSIREYIEEYKHDYKIFFYYLDLGIKAMLNNDGTKYNVEAFSEAVKPYKDMMAFFEEYYQKKFIKTKESTYVNPYSIKIIDYLKSKGYQLVLATNPLFPSFVTNMRVNWAGLNPSDFTYITSYENSKFTKPKKEYFKEILNNLEIKKEDVIYIGNDVDDDYGEMGYNYFESFIIKDCLINKNNKKITIPLLSLEDFYNYLISKY